MFRVLWWGACGECYEKYGRFMSNMDKLRVYYDMVKKEMVFFKNFGWTFFLWKIGWKLFGVFIFDLNLWELL